jgi:putative phage-type endonuclease
MHPTVRRLLEQAHVEQKSQEWLDLRQGMLTASDVATALGENHFEKPSDLILKKCGFGKVFKGNDATRHGEKYEPIARDIYERHTGERVHEFGLVQHPVHNWLGGSPDGITESGILIEIKCPVSRKIKNEVPVHYMAQLQILMEILDLDICDFIQYRPEPYKFVVTRVNRSKDWFSERLPILDDFWKTVLYKRLNGICEII